MQLKHYSPSTIKNYLSMVAAFARHIGKSPELSNWEEVRSFLLYLVETRPSQAHSLFTVHANLKINVGHQLALAWICIAPIVKNSTKSRMSGKITCTKYGSLSKFNLLLFATNKTSTMKKPIQFP
jgi:hypothetical protein